MADIFQWNDIKHNFSDGLIVGNGASMAIHTGFGYKSLYEAAHDNGHLTADVAGVFDAFGIYDFEVVLRRLWHATVVNETLNIKGGRVEEAYIQVRSALIATVRDVHISHDDAQEYLESIYMFMHGFKTVVSLNYDLLVYWAAMQSREKLGNWFKDCFNQGSFVEDWQSMRTPYKAKGTTLYFYPHGNLALARKLDDEEYKITASGTNLLNQVLKVWESGIGVPLFVCEGTSDHKEKSISGSPYLYSIAREVLANMGESLTIYGWSMGEQEIHILTRLKQAHCRRVAVSVYQANEDYIRLVEEKIRNIGIADIVFFDSASPGCWHNPIE